MDNLQAEPSKSSQQHRRMWGYIFGSLLIFIVILIPVTASYAQANPSTGIYDGSSVENANGIVQQPQLPTDTTTPLPTASVGPDFTNTPTTTSTSTSTATSAITNTPTPTKTSTQATKTVTHTPTKTGTATGIPSIKIVVTPTEAKVNQNFTFTIEASNNSASAVQNTVVLDSFPTFIDVLTVTTNKGTVTKLTHNFVVTIGEIVPAEKVTIIAIVKVNSTLTRTETLANIVTLTYGVSKSITASVNYKVLFQTLPPTGELPLNWRESKINWVVSVPGVLLFALGMILLFIAIWTRLHERKNVLWMLSSGMLLVIVGFIVGATAFGIFTPAGIVSRSAATPTSDVIVAQVLPIDQSSAYLPHLPAYAFSTPEAALPIVTLPNYPIPTPVLTVTPKPGEEGPDTSPVVRIAIPSLFLDTIVKYVPYDGFSWMISGLREEIAWMGNTSWPGLGSNTALAGHVTVAGMGDGPFRHLDELREGDVVILYTEKNMYTYTIRESRVTDDSDMAVTWATTNPQVTLITCVDWNEELRTYSNRLIVMGDLMRTEPITAGSIP